MTNKINVALDMINQGLYQEALDKLQNDLLAKIDGCNNNGEPDKNDWILMYTEQKQIYDLITEAINLINSQL
ncbi:MAG: hypothetical protein ACUZ8H_14160 [Candidatus Anammoxibacter sp.]